MAPSSCVIIVPAGGTIEPACEQGLRALEGRGYVVRRAPGFSAIDFGRCVLASAALAEGLGELMWIDSDIAFNPDDVDRLRAHGLPIVCGLYAKKSRREFACAFLPGTEKVVFGQGRGPVEVRYAGFGFTLTRWEVYQAMRTQLRLPDCNQRFGAAIVPYFLPLLVPDGDGLWYLSEDYAFCERARQCAYKVLADTTVRLWHAGSYGFSWEDAGGDKHRYATYTFHLNPGRSTSGSAPTAGNPS